jgi:hypothetical protein
MIVVVVGVGVVIGVGVGVGCSVVGLVVGFFVCFVCSVFRCFVGCLVVCETKHRLRNQKPFAKPKTVCVQSALCTMVRCVQPRMD